MDPSLFREVTLGSMQFSTLSREEYSELLEQDTTAKDTCLHIAAGLGHEKLVRDILTICPTLLTRVNTMNDTALHRAARGGHVRVVEFLSSFPGGAVDFLRMENKEKETVMHEAVRRSDLEMVRLLIEKDPELLCTVNYAGESPLYLAVEQMDLYMVTKITEKRSFSSGGPNGQTALHAAIIHRNLDLTGHLLEKLRHVTKEDDNGKTPLHFASELGFVEVVDMLLKNSTSTTTTCVLDNNGLAAIHIATSLGHVDIIKKLIEVQPDIKDLLDGKGRNILHIAVEFQQVSIVKYLLSEKMFDGLLNGRDSGGNTPLHQASITGNPYIVNLLARNRRVNVKAFNRKRYTRLAMARSKCDKKRGANEGTFRLFLLLVIQSENFRLYFWLVFASLLCVAGPPQGNLKLPLEIFKYLIRDQSSIESYKEKANTLLVVATLVSAVTFAAGFAVPGAMTTLKTDDLRSFLVLNQLGMYLSVVSVLLLIWLQYIQHKLHLRLILIFSQATTTVALAFMTFGFTLAMSSTIPGGDSMRGFRLVVKKSIDYINIVGYLVVVIHLVLVISCYATGVYFLGNGIFPHFLSWVYEYFIRDKEYVSVAERIEKITRQSSPNNETSTMA